MMTQEELYTIIVAGLAGGIAASALGRSRTRIANLVIGAAFTSAMSYYDKPGGRALTVAVATAEGAAWGAADRLIPMAKKELFHKSPEPRMAT